MVSQSQLVQMESVLGRWSVRRFFSRSGVFEGLKGDEVRDSGKGQVMKGFEDQDFGCRFFFV